MTTSATLDLSQRANLPEQMDELCSYDEYQRVIQGLSVVNRVVLANRPTFAFLKRIAGDVRRGTEPLRIVDVGCGDGDLLRRIAVWAECRGIGVALTGIDLNPLSMRAAREATAEAVLPCQREIRWITGDALEYRPKHAVDVILSSHLMHHLSNAQVVHLLQWMERTACHGWFVSDIHRHAVPFHLFGLLARAARWHPIVRDDGLASIQRAFSPGDWSSLCVAAGLKPDTYSIDWYMPFRLCVSSVR